MLPLGRRHLLTAAGTALLLRAVPARGAGMDKSRFLWVVNQAREEVVAAYRHADGTYLLEPGDALFFDAAARHGPEELVEAPMQYLSIIIYPR